MKLSNWPIFLIVIILTSGSCKKDDEGMDPVVLPNISISNLEISEGDDNKTIDIAVSLSGTNSGNAIVSYATLDKTAKNGEDYIQTEGSLTFNAGETSKTIQVEIKGDEFEEPDENFEVLLLNPINANISTAKAVITIKNDDSQVGNPFDIPTSGYTTPISYPGYTLVWNDEFQASTLNTAFWNYEIGNGSGGWGNNELQYYKSENTQIVESEYLVIEAKEEAQSGFNYTSSRLTTQGKKSFQYGRVDIRAALPQGKGLWPALWMLGDNISSVGWPACGEIDIMEIVGHQPNIVHGTVHWDNAGSYASYGNSHTLSSGVFADEFHVFSIEWDANQIVWYMDDIQYNVVDISPTDLSEFKADFFFIFNVAVGGNWPGSPNASTSFPQYMIVDYIRMFQ